MRAWDERSEGKLLSWVDKPGGRLEVDLAMLRSIVELDREKRGPRRGEIEERLDRLERRVLAVRRMVHKNREMIEGD